MVSLSASRCRRRPWAGLVAFTLAGWALAGCAWLQAGGQGPTQSLLTISVIRPNEATLALTVNHNRCGQLDIQVDEFDDEVHLAAWSRTGPGGRDCDDQVFVGEISVELEEAVGDRRLVVEVPSYQLDNGSEHPPVCLVADRPWCQELTIRHGDQERQVGAPGYRASEVEVELDFGPEGSLFSLSDSTFLKVTTSRHYSQPLLIESRTIWRPDLGLWGRVQVHNLERPDTPGQPLDRPVSGYPAWWVTPAGGPEEPPTTVAVGVGAWWVDITLWAEDVADQPAALEALLDRLEMAPRQGGVPRVVDDSGWVDGLGELAVISDDHHGFVLGLAPNCHDDKAVGCIPGVGYASALTIMEALALVAGTTPPFTPPDESDPAAGQPNQPAKGLPLPDDMFVELAAYGDVSDLVACDGVPAFDPDLLPQGMTRHQVHAEVAIYTGIGSGHWSHRSRLGSETHYVGQADDPQVVARYELNNAGTWDTISVTRCTDAG